MVAQQPTLIERPEPKFDSHVEILPLTIFPLDDQLTSPPVSSDFVRSLVEYGQLQVIAVGLRDGEEDDGYWLIDGKRRVKGCRAAGFTTIKALVFTGDWRGSEREIALITNTLRSPNPYTTLEMIQSYVKDGIGPEGIHERTGMDLDLIRQNLRILAMRPPLIEAFLTHKMPRTAALDAAKCSLREQDRLLATLEREGRIKVDDVTQVKEARRAKALAALPRQIEMDELSTPVEEWVLKAHLAAERLLAIIPERERDNAESNWSLVAHALQLVLKGES